MTGEPRPIAVACLVRGEDYALAVEVLDLDPDTRPFDIGSDHVGLTRADGSVHPVAVARNGILSYRHEDFPISDEQWAKRVDLAVETRFLEELLFGNRALAADMQHLVPA